MIRVVRHLKVQDLIKSRLKVPVYMFLAQTNISRQTYFNIMSGKSKPSVRTLEKVCNYFGVSITPFLCEVG